LIQKFSDPPAQHCPDCGGSVKKLLSSPAIQFKGEGWYITDYARKGNSDAGKTAESSASKAETKTETKTESGKSTSSDASKSSSTDKK
jgi:predicted nucleic acid-binding Zn ribbon protein